MHTCASVVSKMHPCTSLTQWTHARASIPRWITCIRNVFLRLVSNIFNCTLGSLKGQQQLSRFIVKAICHHAVMHCTNILSSLQSKLSTTRSIRSLGTVKDSKTDVSIHSDEGLTLETSVFESFMVANFSCRPCG